MNTYAYSEYSAIHSNSATSSSSWSSAGSHRTAAFPGLPSYASHILNFDPPPIPRTPFHGDHYPRERVQPGSPYASPYASRSPYTASSTNSPFLSANSPFLSEHPTETKRNIHSPPPLSLEPLVSGWNTSSNGELFVNVSDLTSSRSSSANSPTTAVLYESAKQSEPHHYDHHSTTEQTPSTRNSSGKRKRPFNVLSSPSPPNSETHDAVDVTSPESGSTYASSYNDEESYSDSDSSYIPSPGRSRRSRPRKRARVSEDADYQFVAEGGKKSRGRKVPVTQEFGAVEGNEAQVTTLPSIPYGIKKAGAPNKNKRRYVCTFEGCGKCFVRGEHLKRHAKSLHLCEKPHECTFPGCTKSFSRKDNLKQHINIFH